MAKGVFFILSFILLAKVYLGLEHKMCPIIIKESINEQILIEQLGTKMHELKNETNQ